MTRFSGRIMPDLTHITILFQDDENFAPESSDDASGTEERDEVYNGNTDDESEESDDNSNENGDKTAKVGRKRKSEGNIQKGKQKKSQEKTAKVVGGKGKKKKPKVTKAEHKKAVKANMAKAVMSDYLTSKIDEKRNQFMHKQNSR